MNKPNFDLMFEEGVKGKIKVEVQDLNQERMKRRRGGTILGGLNFDA